MAFAARARSARVAPQATVNKPAAPAAVDRRAALASLAGAAALVAGAATPAPALAAYGEAANVFGKATNTSGFVPYQGEGFALLLPSKWGPRRQVVAPGVVLSYEDNGDAVNHVDVIARKAGGGDIGSFGGADKFLNDVVRPLLGEQVFAGQSRSEGGFQADKVAAASLLDVQEAKDKNGKVSGRFGWGVWCGREDRRKTKNPNSFSHPSPLTSCTTSTTSSPAPPTATRAAATT